MHADRKDVTHALRMDIHFQGDAIRCLGGIERSRFGPSGDGGGDLNGSGQAGGAEVHGIVRARSYEGVAARGSAREPEVCILGRGYSRRAKIPLAAVFEISDR
jgi:hypothetical protein